jgi:hypothetical protein
LLLKFMVTKNLPEYTKLILLSNERLNKGIH